MIAAPSAAFAQAQTFTNDRLILGGSPDDAIGMWRVELPKSTRFFGQFGLGFSLNPFRNENHLFTPQKAAQVSNPIDTQTTAYFAVGAELFQRVQLQLQFPAILGQSTNPTRNLAAGANDAASPSVAAAGDLKVEGRVLIFRTDSNAFKLGVNATLWAPTGDEFSFAGDRDVHGGFALSMEYNAKSFFLLLNTGVHFKPFNELNDFNVASEWTYSLGAFLPIRNDAMRLGVQVFGSTGIERDTTFVAANTPLEWLAEGRIALDDKKRAWAGLGAGTRLTPGYSPDFRAIGVIGYSFGIENTKPPSPPKQFKAPDDERRVDTDKDGFWDDIDPCVNEPEDGKPPDPHDGCPAPPDDDNDGIPNARDKCPNQAEDFDKIADEDGCPEDDYDKDNVPDAVDACPKEPGEPSGQKDKNGCPMYIRRVEGSNEIQILRQVQFATASAKILPVSYPILDEVLRLLNANPDVKLLSIEGHTDDRGAVSMNEKLSDDRAKSCRQYLVDKGIHPDRLTAHGFGPHKPVADNKTPDGRQKNRRVEFHIRGPGETSDSETPEQKNP